MLKTQMPDPVVPPGTPTPPPIQEPDGSPPVEIPPGSDPMPEPPPLQM